MIKITIQKVSKIEIPDTILLAGDEVVENLLVAAIELGSVRDKFLLFT